MIARWNSAWTSTEQATLAAIHVSSIAAWTDFIDEADAKGLNTFTKEHLSWTVEPELEEKFLLDPRAEIKRNVTCLSEELLFEKLRPTFLIRHPALVLPSLVRAFGDIQGVSADPADKHLLRQSSYRWHVAFYKLYRQHYAANPEGAWTGSESVKYPLVLDASDLADPALLSKYAQVVGLDPGKLLFSWDAQSTQGMWNVEARLLDTLMGSEGVVKSKLAGEVDLEQAKGKWMEEFGVEMGERIAELVDGSMEDYAWLWERRLRV